MLFAILLLCFYVWQLKADRAAELVISSDTPVWDLRDVDMSAHYIRLQGGQAEYVINEYLTPEEFQARTDIRVGVPKDEAEYYTARIRLIVPDGQVYAITFGSVDYSDSIYINGQHMQTVGSPGVDTKSNIPQTTNVYYTVMPVGGVIEVLHQSANFVHREGGNPAGLRIGSVESASRYYARQTLGTAIIMGGCLLLVAVHMVLFLLQKSYRSNLYFALFCLVLLLRIGVGDTKAITALYPNISWYITFRIEYMAIPLGGMLLSLALDSMFYGLLQKTAKAIIIAGNALFAILFVFAPTVTMTHALLFAEGLVLVSAIYIFIRLIMQMRKIQSTEHIIMLCAFIVFVYVMVREMLYHMGILIFPVAYSGMLDFGVLIITLFQMVAAFHGTMRQVAAAKESERVALLKAEALRRDILLKEALHKAIPKGHLVERGPLTLNTLAGQAYLNGEDMLLTPKEFALLHLLLAHEGDVLERQRLYEEVWRQPMGSNTGAIRAAVSRLRKKLKGSGYTIEFIRETGYIFTQDNDKE